MKGAVTHHKPAGFLQVQVDVGVMRTDLLVRRSDVKASFLRFSKGILLNTFTTR